MDVSMRLFAQQSNVVWVEFMVTTDDFPKQVLTYMDPIGRPPTRLDVLQHTMNTAIRVAEECHDSYISVTYDLAITKPALQILPNHPCMTDYLYILVLFTSS
jgi:hypothetical protein